MTLFTPTESLGIGLAPAPGIHIFKESGMLGWKFYPKPPFLGVASVQTLFPESTPNDDPSPEMFKITPKGYLNCPPENKHMVFGSFSPVSSPGDWKAIQVCLYPLTLGFF